MPFRSRSKRVVIIGGGVSGLSAAHRIHVDAPECDVTLLESGPRLGGVIQTSSQDGFLIESAADNFITTTPAARLLCEELGLGNELICTNSQGRGAMVLNRGRLESIPSGFMVMAPSRIWPLLATRILSPKGKLRMGCELFVPRKRDVDDESLQSFVCRRFGVEMFERLVQPLVGGIYTADPNRLSVAATMPRFLEMEKQHGSLIRGMLRSRRKRKTTLNDGGGARYSQFMTLKGGMSRLIDTLAVSLPEGAIRPNTRVTDLAHESGTWQIQTDDDQTLQADAVVVATPAPASAKLLQSISPSASEQLASIEYASCAVVSMAFRRDQIAHPLDSFGFVVPRREEHLILSCSFSSLKYQGRAPDGMVLMRVFIGGACQSGLLRMPDHELAELALWELTKLLDIEGPPVLQRVTRQMHSMPQYHVGHRARVTEIRRHLASYRTLALAGSAFDGVGVPGCIESGQNAARQVCSRMRQGSTITDPFVASC